MKKDTVVIDVELQRASVRQEGGGQEIKIGKQQFALVEFGAGEEAAAIVEHVEPGEGELGVREPAVGRSVQLPQFADVVALPAAHWRQNFLGRDGMGQIVFERPAADLSAVEFEVMESERFGGHKAVGARRRTVVALVEEVQNGLRPRWGVVAARAAGQPVRTLFLRLGAQVSGGQRVEAAG